MNIPNSKIDFQDVNNADFTFNSLRFESNKLQLSKIMKCLFAFIIFINITSVSFSQKVGIGTDTPEAKLDIVSSTDGILVPRVSLNSVYSMSPLIFPSVGELVFNTNTAGVGDSTVSVGFYYWSNTGWVRLKGGISDDDHDWYQNGTSNAPSSINNNIYTNGNVGIGVNNPQERLSIAKDEDESAEIGRAHVGFIGQNDWAGFSHIDSDDVLSYALLQDSNGETILNSASGEDILIRNNNSTQSIFKSNGNVGIGIIDPAEKLSILTDENASAEIGRAHVGFMGYDDYAGFSHIDFNGEFSYALMQTGTGRTMLNAAEGQDVRIKINDGTHSAFESDGDFGVGTINPASKVEVVGDVRINGNDASLIYQNTKETNKEWRLVYVDNFEESTEGWIGNGALSLGDEGTIRQYDGSTGISGYFLRPIDNNHALKKYFDMSELTFTEVKVEFNYFFIDSWDEESGWLGIKTQEDAFSNQLWYKQHKASWSNVELNGTLYISNFFGSSSISDCKHAGMAQFTRSGNFWLEFGANLNSATSDETFGIDNIAVYVK